MPKTAVDATGRPNAIASSIERGSDSTSEALTSTSAAWYQRWMSGLDRLDPDPRVAEPVDEVPQLLGVRAPGHRPDEDQLDVGAAQRVGAGRRPGRG